MKELVGHKTAKAKNTLVAKSGLYGFPGRFSISNVLLNSDGMMMIENQPARKHAIDANSRSPAHAQIGRI